MEVKKIVLAMHNEEKGYGKICKDLQLPKSTVQSIIKKVKGSGNLENLSRSGRPAKVSTTGIRRIVREDQQEPSFTRDEIRSILEDFWHQCQSFNCDQHSTQGKLERLPS